jgi:hypothetical protein
VYDSGGADDADALGECTVPLDALMDHWETVHAYPLAPLRGTADSSSSSSASLGTLTLMAGPKAPEVKEVAMYSGASARVAIELGSARTR